MKKYLGVSLAVVFMLFIGTGIVLATDQPSGNPFTAIWQAITSLQNQINNIILQPGPQGPIGPQGPQGIPGSTGLNLRVIDANGVEVGHVINFQPGVGLMSVNVFDININKFSSYNLKTGVFNKGGVLPTNYLYSELDDCSVLLANEVYTPYQIVVIWNNGKLYSPKDQSSIKNGPIYPKSKFDGNNCSVIDSLVLNNFAEVEPLTLPTYVGPLSIVE